MFSTSGGNTDADFTRVHARLWSNIHRLSAPAESGTGEYGRAQSKYVNNILGANWSNTAANLTENDWARSTRTATGYVAEYRIPHRDGAIAKKDGVIFGFDIQINDVNSAASLTNRRIVTWNTKNNNNTEISNDWGELELIGWEAANAVTAKFTVQENGYSGWQTTSAIDLFFSKDIDTLAAEDITIGGLEGLVKGELTKVNARQYTLAISGITAPATNEIAAQDITVSIDKAGIDTAAVAAHVYYEMNTPPAGFEYFVSVLDPEFDTRMPSSEGLNDPFQFFVTTDGKSGGFGEVIPNRVVTEKDWLDRREEIKALAQYYYYGVTYTFANGTDIKDIITNVTVSSAANPVVTVSLADNDKTATATFTITLPSAANIEAAGYDPDRLPWGVGSNQSAYGIASIGSPSGNAYAALYTTDYRVTGLDAGSIMKYSWNIGIIPAALEWLEDNNYEDKDGNEQPSTKLNPLGGFTTGVSINGKQARFAAMFNDRIAVSAGSESGGHGVSAFRYIQEGRLYNYAGARENATSRYDKIYNLTGGPANYLGWINCNTARRFSEYNIDLLPFDAHLLNALMAPTSDNPNRAIIEFINDTQSQGWTAPESGTLSMLAAKEVFDWLGTDNIVFRVRDGAHALQNRDTPYIVAVMDYLFGPEKENIELRAAGLFNTQYPNNSLSSEYYTKLSDMTVYPFNIQSAYIQWSRPANEEKGIAAKDALYTTTQFVTEGMPAAIEVYTETSVTAVSLKVYDHGDVNPTAPATLLEDYGTFPVTNGRVSINLTANQTKVGRYEITTAGSNGKEKSSVSFDGIDVHTALRHDLSDSSHTTTALGFTSKINQSIIKVFYNDIELPASTQEQEVSNEPSAFIMQYGVSNALSTATTNRVRIENLQLEAMPGYTFVLYHTNLTAPSWASSEAVQRNTSYANWPPYKNGPTSNNGGPAETRTDGSSPILWPQTATNFIADVDFSYDYDNQSLMISFSEPMDRDNFGIGFDFSDNFSLEWAQDNKSVKVIFANNIAEGKLCSLYIMRLRDSSGNMIAEPINYKFVNIALLTPVLSTEDQSTIYTFSGKVSGDIRASVNGDINNPINYTISDEGFSIILDLDYSKLPSGSIITLYGVKYGPLDEYIFNFAIGVK